MPRYCCVPNCTSNRPGQPYVSTFRFPKNAEGVDLWRRKIPRDFEIKKDSVVCIKHFPENSIIRSDCITNKDGTVINIPRTYPKLIDGAYPCIFPNCPKYFTENNSAPRTATIKRQERMQRLDDEAMENFIINDKIESFNMLQEKLSLAENSICIFLKSNNILLHMCCNCISFLFINCNDSPSLIKCVKISESLSINFYVGTNSIPVDGINKILNTPFQLTLWSELENVLNFVKFYDVADSNVTAEYNYSNAVTNWSACVDDMTHDYDYDWIESAHFILEQMKLLKKSNRNVRYSSSLIIFAFCIYLKSPACYSYLYKSKMFRLPCLRHLKRLSGNLQMTAGTVTDENEAYLLGKCNELATHEKFVIVQIDEIYIKPSLTFKAKHLIGLTEKGEEASTIQAFMYSSVLSKHKEIIALNPVSKMTTDDLYAMTIQVLTLMERVGFTVVTLISDNNRVNRNMYSKLSGGEIKHFIQNPCNVSKKLFLLFDSVHLLKSIRNNWLNQKDFDKTFTFPDPRNFDITMTASLSFLRKIYNMEVNTLVKLAPKLSLKVLKPSNLERQNVKLALKIFDETNAVALCMLGDKLGNPQVCESTAYFIRHIVTFWQMMNISHPKKGYYLRQVNSVPFVSIEDEKLVFMNNFVLWLKAWKNLKQNKREGCLTDETCFALEHTVAAMCVLIKYLLTELKMKYVLTNKFQTDNLESRFGQYRQMSGSNYYITVHQVLEAEKKLRIKSLLKLHSERFGSIAFKDLVALHSFDTVASDVILNEKFNDIVNEELDFDNLSVEEIQVLTYISGYCAHALRNQCECCRSIFILDKEMHLEAGVSFDTAYLCLLDRGGLKMPTTMVVEIVTSAYLIFKLLISNEYEEYFLKSKSQFKLFVQIVQLYLEQHDLAGNTIYSCSSCNKVVYKCTEKLIHTFANICLNNYTKQRNDMLSREKDNRKLKKLKNK